MKKIILSLTLFTATVGYAQIVNIPDANFKNTLVNDLTVDIDGDWVGDLVADTNGDGEIQLSEAQSVPALDLVGKNINSLEGIQSFTALESLHARDNNLTTVDISQNQQLLFLDLLINDLVEIDLSQNVGLEKVFLGQNNLTSMDISQNINLVQFHCSNNNISELDIVANQSLQILELQGCNINSIDLTQNSALTNVRLGANNLTTIDVSQNVLLERLSVGPNDLSEIDLSQNVNLVAFGGHQSDFTSFDFSNNPALEEIGVWGNDGITELDFSQNPNLTRLACYMMDNLTSLNVKNGNNTQMINFSAFSCPVLECIEVDDPVFSANSEDWSEDEGVIYSENCENLSVEDVLKSQFSLYPNPAKDNLQIQSQYPLLGKIQLVDLQGRTIQTLNATNTVDVSQLVAGVYFLKLAESGIVITKKFIKE